MEYNDLYSYILKEENTYKTQPIPVADGWDWNMFEHIRRSTLYKNSKFYMGANDGLRPFKNIIRPILNVAYRSEGFDVKDIQPFVNDSKNYYKSFLVQKYHEKWARENNIDTFIDELVESYVDYGGAIVKNVGVRPEVVPLQRLAFCDQTDILSGNICEKHEYSIDQLRDMKGKWDDSAIEQAILTAEFEKDAAMSQGREAKTPNKYIEVYEVHGTFPTAWLDDSESYTDKEKFSTQVHICCFYEDGNNRKQGITLFKGPEKEPRYKVIIRDKIFGRALGMGGIEELFEGQTWTNYAEIKIKDMLDAASLMLLQTSDTAFGNRNKLTDLQNGEVIVTEDGKPITQVNIQPMNMVAFDNAVSRWEQHSRTTGSADDAQLGINPASGTPFRLQALVVQEGKGLHDYRRGQIANFVGEIYRDWILKYLVKEMNRGQTFISELSADELNQLAESVVNNQSNKAIKKKVMQGGMVTPQEVEVFKQLVTEQFKKGGNKRFLDIAKGELASIPVDVEINVAGKQKNLSERADKLTNIFRQIAQAPQILQIPGMSKLFNDILEASGLSPVDFSELTKQSSSIPSPMQPQVSPIQNQGQPLPTNAPQQ